MLLSSCGVVLSLITLALLIFNTEKNAKFYGLIFILQWFFLAPLVVWNGIIIFSVGYPHFNQTKFKKDSITEYPAFFRETMVGDENLKFDPQDLRDNLECDYNLWKAAYIIEIALIILSFTLIIFTMIGFCEGYTFFRKIYEEFRGKGSIKGSEQGIEGKPKECIKKRSLNRICHKNFAGKS